jgi:DNA-directed RNA polymerase specialized sigma24 family protein
MVGWVAHRFQLSTFEAEDVIQGTFTSFLCSPATIRQPEAWMMRVAARGAARRCRERAAAETLGPSHDLPKKRDLILALDLRRAVGNLPKPWQEILRMRYVEEIDCPSIALNLGHESANVRQIVHRTLVTLREALSP